MPRNACKKRVTHGIVDALRKTEKELAENTVCFLSRALKRQQFALQATMRKRRTLQKSEDTIRQSIRQLKSRIQSEFDAHPTIFRRK